MTPDMDQLLFNKLTEVAHQQAAAATQQAVSVERMVNLLERMNDQLDRAESERNSQHERTRDHLAMMSKTAIATLEASAVKRDDWWRRALVVMGLSIALSELLGVAAMKFLALLK